MRQDQYERLQALSEKLVDVFADEAEPANWSGAGLLPKDMAREDRGDRYWCKRNAAATMVLVLRVETLIGQQQGQPTAPAQTDDGEADLDKEVAAAERDAERLLARVRKTARGNAA